MSSRYAIGLCIALFFLPRDVASSDDVKTHGICSPIVASTEGDVTVTFSSGCNLEVTPAQLKQISDSLRAGLAVPPELLDRYNRISKRLGVTEAAVTTFLRILGQGNVPIQDLDSKLREVAAQHLTLVQRTKALENDSSIAANLKQVLSDIESGSYDATRQPLEEAYSSSVAAAQRLREDAAAAQDEADRKFLAAAKTKSIQGQLQLVQLHYSTAMKEFSIAADVVPGAYPLYRSRYLYEAGRAAALAGDPAAAVKLLNEAGRIQTQILGFDNEMVALTLNSLGSAFLDRGRPYDAEQHFKRAIAIIKKLRGTENDPDYATGLTNLGTAFAQSGNYDAAILVSLKAVDIFSQTLNEDDQRRAAADSNLAGIYQLVDIYDEAEFFYKRALAAYERRSEPAEMIVTLSSLGELYRKKREYAEAERLQIKALSMSENALGPEHPRTAICLNNLGLVYSETGRVDDAERLFKKTLELADRYLGKDDPSVAIRLNNLGILYANQKRYAEAEHLLLRAVAINTKRIPEHSETANSNLNLAMVYRGLGRYEDARPLAERALAIYQEAFGSDHPRTKRAQTVLNDIEARAKKTGAKRKSGQPSKNR